MITKINVNSPTLLVITGGACLIGFGIFAHRAGRRVDDTLDMHRTQVDNLKDMRDAGEFVDKDEDGNETTIEFSENDYKKELTHTYVTTGLELVKLYGPVVVLGAGTFISFFSGNRILAKRLAGVTAAYGTLQEAYMTYRENVTKDLGEEADFKYLYGMDGTFKEKYYDTKIDEKTGEVVNVGKAKVREIDVVNDVKDWNKVKGFTHDYEYNKFWLERIESLANGKLETKGYLTLYDVYDALGIVYTLDAKHEMMSHEVGWVKGYGDDDVRFNLVMVPTVCGVKDGAVGNLSEVGLIDFNCVGTIWDKLVPNRD